MFWLRNKKNSFQLRTLILRPENTGLSDANCKKGTKQCLLQQITPLSDSFCSKSLDSVIKLITNHGAANCNKSLG